MRNCFLFSLLVFCCIVDVNAENQPTDSLFYSVFTVALDGSGDFSRIQDAIDATKAFPPARTKIYIKDGVYFEKVRVYEWNSRLSIVGESKEKTIIRYDDHFEKIGKGRNSTFHTYTLKVDADDVIIRNLTVENASGDIGQAIAVATSGNRICFIHCKILGNQDSFYLSGNGKVFIYRSYIEGTTDFIFGNSTAYFEECEIHSKKDSYITAASTAINSRYGFVFVQCKLTADPDVSKVYLGRPWREYAKTIFLNCEMGHHIIAEGWHDWSKESVHETVWFGEFGSYGQGAVLAKRVEWSHLLSSIEAEMITPSEVLEEEGTYPLNWYRSGE